MLTVDRHQVLAFRLDGHHLARRLPSGSLTQAAAACGIRNAPPWAAPLSFLARVDSLAAADLDRAVDADKTLIQVWSLRLAPFFVPAGDLAVFTTALLPNDEAAARLMTPKLLSLLDAAGISATEAMRRIAAAAAEALDERTLSVLRVDRARLESPPMATGARFLPPSDSYLLLRDRETLTSDRVLRAYVWRPSGTPGVALVDGEAAATWSMRAQGRRLSVAVVPFTTLDRTTRAALEAEAAALARFRGCTSAEVTIVPAAPA